MHLQASFLALYKAREILEFQKELEFDLYLKMSCNSLS